MKYGKYGKVKVPAKVEDLIGKTITKVEQDTFNIVLYCKEGVYRFYHEQNCCEDVSIDDICGDINDLCGKVFLAEERQSCENPEGVEKEYQGNSCTWTFYHFVTDKGYIDIRWYGESNGYYSEDVDIVYYPAPGYIGKGSWVEAYHAKPENDDPVLCRMKIAFRISSDYLYCVCRYHEEGWYFLAMDKREAASCESIQAMTWTPIPENWNLRAWKRIE